MKQYERVFVPNACYHVFTRGNRKYVVFQEPRDYQYFLSLLVKAKRRYIVRLYAYCLMPNHTHLLIDPVNRENLVGFMHWLNRGYAHYFNNKYNTVGHLWQGRYQSRVIVKDEYLSACASYIEGNPVRASIAGKISEYPWSSYGERCHFASRGLLDEIIAEQIMTQCGS